MHLLTIVLSLFFATRPQIHLRTPYESKARMMLTNLTLGRFPEAQRDFNETMLETVTPEYLAGIKKQLDAEAGAFQYVSNVREGRDEQQFRFVELTVRYEKSTALLRVTFDPTNKIGGISLDRVVAEKVDPELEAKARALLAAFIEARFTDVGRDFDPAFALQLTPDRIHALRDEITETYGAYRAVAGAKQRTEKDYRIIELTAAFDRKASVLVVFNPAGKVSGLRFSPSKER